MNFEDWVCFAIYLGIGVGFLYGLGKAVKAYRQDKLDKAEFDRKWNTELESINERNARNERLARRTAQTRSVPKMRGRGPIVVSGQRRRAVYPVSRTQPSSNSASSDAGDLLIAGAAGFALGSALSGGGRGGEDSTPVGGGGSFDGGGASSSWGDSSSSDSSSSSSSDSSSSSSSESGGSSDSAGGDAGGSE